MVPFIRVFLFLFIQNFKDADGGCPASEKDVVKLVEPGKGFVEESHHQEELQPFSHVQISLHDSLSSEGKNGDETEGTDETHTRVEHGPATHDS